jgi:hypothetical protein
MNKSLQGRFREIIHNNYTLYYFFYMYTQICDENALIWDVPATSHMKFYYEGALIKSVLCHYSNRNKYLNILLLTQ